MRLKSVFAAAAAILCSSASLPAQEVTLRAVTASAEGSQSSKSFESMIEKSYPRGLPVQQPESAWIGLYNGFKSA